MNEMALDAEVALQNVAHAGGQHEQPGRHVVMVEDRHALAVRSGLQPVDAAGDEANASRQFGAHGGNEIIVEDAVVACAGAIEEAALADVDDLVEGHGCRRKPVQKAKPAQFFDLVAADFLDTEFLGKTE